MKNTAPVQSKVSVNDYKSLAGLLNLSTIHPGKESRREKKKKKDKKVKGEEEEEEERKSRGRVGRGAEEQELTRDLQSDFKSRQILEKSWATTIIGR
jgi:hypothetical protein